jgi:hypothetical protein
MAAVNIRVLFSVWQGDSTNWRLGEISPTPAKREILPEHKRFWEDRDTAVECIRTLQEEKVFAKNPVPKKSQMFLPNEFVGLFNAIGYKEWHLFNGNTADTEALALFVNSVLEPQGIRNLQFCTSTMQPRKTCWEAGWILHLSKACNRPAVACRNSTSLFSC